MRAIFSMSARWGLGQMRSAPAVGAAVFGVILSVRPLQKNVGVTMLAAVAVFGLATAVFGISRNYTLSLAMLAVLGAADMISVFIRGSLIQLNTPDAMRGRVSAISGLAIGASNELERWNQGLPRRCSEQQELLCWVVGSCGDYRDLGRAVSEIRRAYRFHSEQKG